MPRFDYRAIQPGGGSAQGTIEAVDRAQALTAVRKLGLMPVEIVPAAIKRAKGPGKLRGKARANATNAIGELAVLLKAGLPLDRALALIIENVEDRTIQSIYVQVLADVREGIPLSRAMGRFPAAFPAVAVAMTEAGEANGALSAALTRLATMLEQAEQLRRTVSTAMIYPAALFILAIAVILLMLLFVVPQFESVFATAQGKLPASSIIVMAASRGLRDYGLELLGFVVAGIFLLRMAFQRPGFRAWFDAFVLTVPQLGTTIRFIETARFARTLGVLVEGEVALPAALALARRTIANRAMGGAVETVSQGLKEGGGLTAPLAAARVLPRIAIGFLRTGEESSQLGPMLERLADVLDRDINIRLQRLIGIMTPIITVVMGATVAAIIASVMSAILGFNDLAIAQ